MNKNDPARIRKTDIQFVLKSIDGKRSSLLDGRLFTGENNMHAVFDPQLGLWYLKYDKGGIPGPLKQKFTDYATLMKHVLAYLTLRNVEIVEILD